MKIIDRAACSFSVVLFFLSAFASAFVSAKAQAIDFQQTDCTPEIARHSIICTIQLRCAESNAAEKRAREHFNTVRDSLFRNARRGVSQSTPEEETRFVRAQRAYFQAMDNQEKCQAGADESVERNLREDYQQSDREHGR